jgi:NAD(P)H-dependent flavin oxidoreductase YrpB (nitropropane dioxygenase family)
MAPARLQAELARHRERCTGPVAVNLLLPFARRGHLEAARKADLVVTFWGRPRRASCRIWLAGGVAERADAEAALAAGADAVVAGTRFLLTEESDAHPGYKRRLLDARATVLTELFGAGWPAPHRVVPNAATERWLRGDERGPAWLRALHRVTAPAIARLPPSAQERAARAQRVTPPVLTPAAPTTESPDSLLDAAPLYAGECVARIDDVRPAGELVRALAGATPRG